MRTSLRVRLFVTFLLLLVAVGAGTFFAIWMTLSNDQVESLKSRMRDQAQQVAAWLDMAGHPDRLAPRLAAVTGARITIIGGDGLVEGDSFERSSVGRPIGHAPEVALARRGERGEAIRRLRPDEEPQVLIAVTAEAGRVVRLAVSAADIARGRDLIRNRLLIGGAFGVLGCLFLAWVFIRAITRPLQAMTRTADRLAKGDYDVPPPDDPGGELGVLSRAIARLASEVKARFGELTQQRDLLATVFGGLVEGVVVVDRSGAIVLVNEAARPHLRADGVLPAALDPLVRQALGGRAADEELELSGRAVRASAIPLGDPGAIVVLYDVTRMRALESVRREFLSNAAHELRTPVTSIAGYTETLLAGKVDAETQKEFLQTIHRNADRIASLVNDLVLLDTLGGRASAVVERASIPLAQVVSDAARTARGVTPSAQIEVDVPAGLAVLGTRDGLDHVVQNLIDNAIKYGASTKVTVTASVVEAPPSATSSLRARASSEPPARSVRVRLAVADRGPGIPRGQEDRVFERFYRIDAGRSRDRGGSGLGLAIVKSQAEAMGGRVWVEPNAPGARFVVELDAA